MMRRLIMIACGAAVAAACSKSAAPGAATQPGLLANVTTSPPETDTYFICPSVSTNNSHGTWVIGHHGGYYVLIPTQGATGSKVFLTVPVRVTSVAEIPAGWALYKDLPSYPNFEGSAVILSEGITTWLNDAPGFNEGDQVAVVNLGNGSYSVTVIGSMMTPQDIGHSVTIDHPIPLASAALW